MFLSSQYQVTPCSAYSVNHCGNQGLLAQMREARERQRNEGVAYSAQGMCEALRLTTERFVTRTPAVELVRDVELTHRDDAGPPVLLRIYHPDPDRALPVLVFAHGGGHMAGSIGVYDAIARKLALAADRVLVSVEYRLAPEFPYPAGLDDLQQVIRHLFGLLQRESIAHVQRLAVGGGAIVASAVQPPVGRNTVNRWTACPPGGRASP